MKVLKFGGTSVGSSDAIKQVGHIILESYQTEPQLWVVASAFSGVTNALKELGERAACKDGDYTQGLTSITERHISMIESLKEKHKNEETKEKIRALIDELSNISRGIYLIGEASPKSMDLLLSFGERLSGIIIADYLQSVGLPISFLDARELIVTDDTFGCAHVRYNQTFSRIRNFTREHSGLYLVTGFIAATEDHITTTLGRGGSDYTATIIGAALEASIVEIWTDVNGMMSANPMKVPQAFSLESLTYEEAMELSHFGAKVVYPLSLQPAHESDIPVIVKNTFCPEFKGTKIQRERDGNVHSIKGITSIENIAIVRIEGSGMLGISGIAARVFSALSGGKINVLFISQGSSEHSICIGVLPSDGERSKALIDEAFRLEINAHSIDRAIIEYNYATIAVVGENMRMTSGIAAKLFGILGQNGINVVAIAQGSSEINVSFVVSHNDEVKALNALHDVFFYPERKVVHLFMIGPGLVGSTFLKFLGETPTFTVQEKNIAIKLIGIGDSKKMYFNEKGIDTKNWRNLLNASPSGMSLNVFIENMKKFSGAHRLFIDSTASEEVASTYREILQNGISIATPNKIANTKNITAYMSLRKLTGKYNAHFLYETTVGAGLPIINTLQELIAGGEKILKVEGVLSGTLSYLFNTFHEDVPFSQVVRKAKELGYTEPDPRVDLQGIDVRRKILILAREAGARIELGDISVEPFIPPECFNATTIEDFFKILEKYDTVFNELVKRVRKEHKVLRHIASYSHEGTSVSLQEVEESHPFYSLSGNENIVAITTENYRSYPLVIKGPGAGAEVTARGLITDVLRFAHIMYL